MRFWQFLTIHLILLTAATANAEWATLSGQFVYGDPGTEIPDPAPIVITKDKNACCKIPLVNESLLINPKNRGIKNVVIWAYKPTSIHPTQAKPPAKPAVVLNENCRFEPHIVLVRTGQKLEVGNPDPVAHNAMVTFIKNRGENPLLPPNGTATFNPTKAEIIPVKIGCAIHPWMQGRVLVQDHPYMAKTDKNGKFELKDMPSGEVTLKVWHERLGYVKTFTIDDKEEVMLKRGKYTLNLKPGSTNKHAYKIAPKLFVAKR